MLKILWKLPRTVRGPVLPDQGKRTAAGNLERAPRHRAVPAERTDFGLRERPLVSIGRCDQGCARQRKVAEIATVGTLAVVDLDHGLRNESVDVEIALAVSVCAEIPG